MNAQLVERVPDETSLLPFIQRAASNPDFDVDKLERLVALYERGEAKKAEIAFNVAMANCQELMRPIEADAENPQTRSKYATYAKLDKALRPIYNRFGFSLSFDTGETDKPEHIRVVCYVAQREGFSRTYHIDMPADGKGAKGNDVMTKTHAVGAGASYGMRYLLKMIFNVLVGEDDDDGNLTMNGAALDWVAKISETTDLAELKSFSGEIAKLNIDGASKGTIRKAYQARKAQLEASP